jgi:acetyltransferase-like isoleucine patch superfamily enzyme
MKLKILYLLTDALKSLKSTITKYECYYYHTKLQGKFSFSTPPQLGKNFLLDLKEDSRIIFKGPFTARGNFSIIGRKSGQIRIGTNVFFNLGCSISCLDFVSIGDNVMFGENVKIYDHNHEFRDKEKQINEQGFCQKPVKIGNNCWIGTNVVILKGVEIGDNSVIGANVVVRENIEAGQLVYNKQVLEIVGIQSL